MTNKEIVKAWFANIDSNNFEAVKQLMDAKHSFKNPMTPAPVGIDQHIGMVQMMTGALNGHHEINHIVDEGDMTAVSGVWRGKHTGEFNGVPATGKDVVFSWIDMFRIVNGKVVEEHLEMNPMSIMAQIGS